MDYGHEDGPFSLSAHLVTTVKAPNFGRHGNFGPFLAGSVAFLHELCTKKNRTDFENLKFFYTFHLLHVSVGRAPIMANPSENVLEISQTFT